MKKKILEQLKARYKNIGFSEAALEAVASMLEANVKEETEIETAVAGVESLLKGFQGDIGKQVNALKAENERLKKQQKTKSGQEEGDPPNPKEVTEKKEEEGIPEWAKRLDKQMETLANGLVALQTEKISSTRTQVLENKLKDAPGIYKKTVLRHFDPTKYKTDEEFNTYLEEIGEEAKEAAKEFKTNSVSSFGRPMVGNSGNDDAESSDDEVDAVVDQIM